MSMTKSIMCALVLFGAYLPATALGQPQVVQVSQRGWHFVGKAFGMTWLLTSVDTGELCVDVKVLRHAAGVVWRLHALEVRDQKRNGF